MKRFLFLLATAAVLASVALVQFDSVRPGRAQDPPGSPPPTYDYDPNTPGTQPPTSPLLAHYEARLLRLLQITVPVTVPLDGPGGLQALLPPGFQAIANPPGSDTTTVNLLFGFQQRLERTDTHETLGPAAVLQIVVPAVSNTNTAPPRPETINLVWELTDAASRDALNALYGPGSSRMAKIEVQIEEQEGQLRLKYDVEDEELGLKVHLQAAGPAAISGRFKNDPAGANRFLNGTSPNPTFIGGGQGDVEVVPTASADVVFKAAGGQLRLPGGDLTVLDLGSSLVFLRNLEFIFKLE